MLKVMKFFVFSVCVLCLAGVTGCRNHIKDYDNTMTDYERSVLRDVASVQVLERDEDNASFRFKITGNRESEVKVFQVRNTFARFTPYQGLREFYEVPLGFILLPVGLTSHVLNIVTLGIFPYSWCWELDCFSFAALNPFMNTESSDRFEDEPRKSVRDLVDTRPENTTYSMHHTGVIFRIGKATQSKMTDNTGVVQFDLIDALGKSLVLNSYEREFKIFVGTAPEPAFTWIIPRRIRQRLMTASSLIAAYQKNPSVQNLRKTVSKLEELKFSRLSYFLEQNEIKKRDDVFKNAYYAEEPQK